MKSSVAGYDKSPFYFAEQFQGANRWVAWTGDQEQQKQAFLALLDIIGPRVDYLFKEYSEQSEQEIVWKRTVGGITPSDLRNTISIDDEWFFGDGGFQFCARIPEATDYFAYDEHGLFWIYSDKSDFEDTLKRLAFEHRKDNLITEQAHWHVGVKDSNNRAEQFRTALIKASVYVSNGGSV